MSKRVSVTREQYDEDLADLLKVGRVKAVLSGVNVRLVAANKIQRHHHVLGTDEALKRLQLKPVHKSVWRRLWEWIKD